MNNLKQNILVPVSFTEQDRTAIKHGIEIAKAFNKNLTLFAVSPNDVTSSTLSEVEKKLMKLVRTFSTSISPHINYLIRKGSLMPALKETSDQIEAASIIMVMEKNSKLRFYRDVQFLKETKQLKMPFLMVQEKQPSQEQAKVIYLPIGFKKEEKEKLIWAAYFGRFNNSKIVVLKARESDSTAKARILAHILFAKKLFDQFNLNYEIIESKKSSFGIAKEAIQMANTNQQGIVVICTTKHYGPEEEIIGPPELKIIKNREQVPVFCVNPRTDLYVLCE